MRRSARSIALNVAFRQWLPFAFSRFLAGAHSPLGRPCTAPWMMRSGLAEQSLAQARPGAVNAGPQDCVLRFRFRPLKSRPSALDTPGDSRMRLHKAGHGVVVFSRDRSVLGQRMS